MSEDDGVWILQVRALWHWLGSLLGQDQQQRLWAS